MKIVKLNDNEFAAFVKIRNVMEAKRLEGMIEFNSNRHIASVYDNSKNPCITSKRLVAKMLKIGIFRVNENEKLVLDNEAFNNFFDSIEQGKEMWRYMDNRMTYFK